MTETVTLIALGEAPYREYREHLVRDYALDKVRAGAWSAEEAESKAEQELDELLPDGPATRSQFLYSVRADSVPAEVGNLWFALSHSGVGRILWIYDIIIHEQFSAEDTRAVPWNWSRRGRENSARGGWNCTCSDTMTGRGRYTSRWDTV